MRRSAAGLALACLIATMGVAPAASGGVALDDAQRWLDPVFTEVDRTSGIAFASSTAVSGATETLRLDLFSPRGDTAVTRPAIVFIHGGGFTGGARTSPLIVAYAEAFARRGYVTASIEYRLRPDVSDPVQLGGAMRDAGEDAAAAVRWLRAHATTHRIDPARIVLAGYSAGAVTALVAGLGSADRPGGSGTPDQPSDVAAVVSLAGFAPGDLQTGGQPPALLFHGTEDPTVPFGLGRDTCTGLVAAGSRCDLVVYDGLGHDLSSQRDDITGRVAGFLAAEVLPVRPPARVREISLRAGHGAALVSWRSPGTTGGEAVERFRVGGGVPSLTLAGAETESLVTGLSTTAAAPTEVTLAAGTSQGWGPDGVPAVSVTGRFTPFASSAELVRAVLTRLVGVAPSTATVIPPAVQLGDGRLTSIAWIEAQMAATGWTATVEPLVRLYAAVLARLPDGRGLEEWVRLRRAGTALTDVAAAFCRSRELRDRFGPPTGSAFVTRLYQNVLGRSPDAAGLWYWTARLASGASCSRVVLGFSESAEHRARTAPTVGVVTRWFALHQRVPLSGEVLRWHDEPTERLIAWLLLSPAMPG